MPKYSCILETEKEINGKPHKEFEVEWPLGIENAKGSLCFILLHYFSLKQINDST